MLRSVAYDNGVSPGIIYAVKNPIMVSSCQLNVSPCVLIFLLLG